MKIQELDPAVQDFHRFKQSFSKPEGPVVDPDGWFAGGDDHAIDADVIHPMNVNKNAIRCRPMAFYGYSPIPLRAVALTKSFISRLMFNVVLPTRLSPRT